MSVTGTQVANRLRNLFGDASDAVWSEAVKMEAINAAIDAAWGKGLKDIRRDSAITLSSSTFEYTPTATPELEEGFAAAYVTPNSPSNEVKVRLHRVRQRLNGTTWTVVVPPDITSCFDGNALHLDYNARIARIAALTDSIELPFDYLWSEAAAYLMLSASLRQANFNTKPFEAQVAVWQQRADRSAMVHRRGLVTRLPMAHEYGSGYHTRTRYGGYIP